MAHLFPNELPSRIKNVLFVCTGNSCRSVFAEYYFRKLATEDGLKINVRSAGTAATEGRKAAAQTIDSAKKHGLNAERHRTQKLVPEMVHQAEVIFVMQKMHRKEALVVSPGAEYKIYLLSDFYEGPEKNMLESGIPDPIGMNDLFHESVNEMLAAACQSVVDEIKKQALPVAQRF